MKQTSSPASRKARFILYLGFVASVVMLAFPPFTSLSGTEFAFLLTGPEWLRGMESLADQYGLAARIDWIALTGQLAVVWAVVLGALWYVSETGLPRRPMAPAIVVACVSLLMVPFVSAQSAEHEQTESLVETDLTVGLQGGRFGVGFASSWPAYGLSGTIQLSETMTAEAVVGFLGTISNFGGRAWYRFNRNTNYDLYGYGAASLFQYRYTTLNSSFERRRATESVIGIGAGAGIETGLRTLFNDETLPPIFFNWEIGLSVANFEHYNFSSFVYGAGIHYRFGDRR